MKNLIILSIPLMFSGCYSNIDLDHYKNDKIENMVVLNSLMNPDSMITVIATHPYFFSDPHPKPSFESNLDIELYINGRYEQSLKFDSLNNFYYSDIFPQPGDSINIMTEFNGIRISAKDEIPKRVTIESFTARISGPYPIYWQDDYIIDYEINFTDPADEDNYYFLEFGEPYGLGGYLHEGEKVYDKEFVFQILASQIDESIPGWEPYSVKGLPFSDNGINGKNYTLHLSEIIQQAGKDYEKYIGLPREAKLYSISKDYYRFMISLIATDPEDDSIHGSLLGLGMVEPGRIYTNVAGGAGIVGSYIFDIATTNISK